MSAGSIELRINDTGAVCDWGTIEHPEPRPDLAEVGHLMVTTGDYVDKLLRQPGALKVPPRGPHIGFHSATTRGGRTFVHHDYNGQRWTWELFPAHWWDGLKVSDLYVGRWPD